MYFLFTHYIIQYRYTMLGNSGYDRNTPDPTSSAFNRVFLIGDSQASYRRPDASRKKEMKEQKKKI